MNNKLQLGQTGEDIVAKKLKAQGFYILHRNYRKRYGEVDLVAGKKDLLLFIEVKMRKNPRFELEYLITYAKQKKITMVAKEYIARYQHEEKTCRFDVALIEGTKDNHKLTYIPNAFESVE